MRTLALIRFALTISAAALIGGCSGSQLTVGPPGAMPRSNTPHLPNTDRYAVLFNFGTSSGSCVDGAYPTWGLVPMNGLLYGSTYEGGTNYSGTVFSISADGTQHVVADFPYASYGNPAGPSGLVAVDGRLYGTQTPFHGGPFGSPYGGEVFSLHNNGKIRMLHTFGNGSDGSGPVAPPTALGGELYGTTSQGGAYGGTSSIGGPYTDGTVYAVDMKTGRERILHSFSDKPDGRQPDADLAAVNGTLYGTTYYGGKYGGGTVFSIGTSGTEQVLYSFGSTREGGLNPSAGLINVKGTLYGTTSIGGPYDGGTVFSIKLDGSDERTLHDFGNASDGDDPRADLLAVGGKLYGTTAHGGSYGGANYDSSGYSGGTLFSIGLHGGKEVVLHSFGSGTDGAVPLGAVVAVRHTLYGTTFTGGTNYGYCYSFYGANGTVFKWQL